MSHNTPTAYTSASVRAQLTVWLLGISGVLYLISVGSDYAQIVLLDRLGAGENIAMEILLANDQRVLLLSRAVQAFRVLAGIAFCFWIYRAYSNLTSLGARELPFSPAWAVGGFFAPIVSFWYPYLAMSALWRASDPETDPADPSAWVTAPATRRLGWWWGLYWGAGFVVIVGAAWLSGKKDLSSLVTGTWLHLLSSALYVVDAVFVISLIREIQARQEAKMVRVSEAFYSPPGAEAPGSAGT